MKFVLLTQYYPPEVGGAQVLMSSFARELQLQGHEVRVITAVPNYATGKIFDGYRNRLTVRETREGIPVFRSWVYPAQSARLIPRLANYFTFCISSLLAFSWMGNPDIVFVDSPPLFLSLTALLIARLKGARWVMNISDLWPDAVAESGMVDSGVLLALARELEKFLYRSADFVGAVTEGIHKILVNGKGVPESKILFLPIGVDTQLFQPRSADQALLSRHSLSGKSVFLYAGTLGHAQGLPLLLEAADRLRFRQDIVVAFVGDGPVKARLLAECARRGFSNVIFADPVALTEMPRWWSISKAALVTLTDQAVHQSARPSKCLPALSSGVPVLFSGRGEMARILSDSQSGIVIAPEQVEPLVACILRIADDPALAHGLGENGRKLCEEQFSWHLVVQQWLADITSRINADPSRIVSQRSAVRTSRR
jgi:glycosyltransferase involved in cell wall biosynthesis